MANKKKFKKYSFNERSAYHNKRASKFIDKFTVKTEYGVKTDFEKLHKAEKNNSSFSYSDGYTSGSFDALRDYKKEDFSNRTSAYKKGYEKAQKNFQRILNQKF